MKIKEYFSKKSNIFTFIFLLLICVLGFVLRVRNLSYLSLWGDDGHTFIGTVSILKHGYPLLPSGNVLWHGIFDYYLKALPSFFLGTSEFSLRIVSVFFGTGTILATYFFGKELANRFVGLLGAFIIAFSTWYVQFSREARYYQDYQFFYMLSFLFFYLGFVKNKKPFRVLAVIFMVLTPLVHGVGIVLILLFILLLFYKGKKFFKKETIIPLVIVFVLDEAQIINQVFFWKVGRSFYSEGTGLRSMTKAYFQIPDPYYFNVIKLMFPGMFYVFMAGIVFFIIFSIIISIKKEAAEDNYLEKENFIKWGRLRWPYNYFLILSSFILSVIFISLGKMYGQQRYVYFLMPVFVIGFSYTVFLFSLFLKRIITGFSKAKSEKAGAVILAAVFVISSALLVNGIKPREAISLPYRLHNEKLNIFYSISNSWSVHWDAATAGKYVAEHAGEDDIIITTDIYNSPPYTGRVNYWLWTGNLVSWAPYHNESGRIIDDTYGVELLRSPMAFFNILNENTDKNIWVITSRSLFTKEHVDPLILDVLEKSGQYQVLTARDDVSRLYFFPVTDRDERILLSDVFQSDNAHIISLKESGKIFFDFTNKAAEKYLVYGFSHVEENSGTWATGLTSVLFLNIDDTNADYKLTIESRPLHNGKSNQRINIHINDEKVSDYKYESTAEFEKTEFILKGTLFNEGFNVMTFDYKYSTTPAELGISNDSRSLSVFFKSMEIKKLE